MEKTEITREEAGKICKDMSTSLRQGVLNEIQVLHDRLFDEAPTENELEPIWIMAGQSLCHIMKHFHDTLADIEAGRYLPKPIEGTT